MASATPIRVNAVQQTRRSAARVVRPGSSFPTRCRCRCRAGCWPAEAPRQAGRRARPPRARTPSRSRTRTDGPPSEIDERGVLHVGRSRRRHQTEEHEDEQLTEPEVSVGPRTTGVGPSRQTAEQTERDEPPGDPCGQHEAGQAGHAEGDEGCGLDLAHRGQLARDEPDRADPARVGTPHAVRVVVDVVRADLDAQRHHECQEGVEPRELTVEVGADRGVACAR